MRRQEADFGLTRREIEVVALRARGVGIREIALRLDLKPTSVDRYLQRIAMKIGSRDRAFLAQFAREYNILNDDHGSRQ